MQKQQWFVKAVRNGFVTYQGWIAAVSAKAAIEASKLYAVGTKGSRWTATEA